MLLAIQSSNASKYTYSALHPLGGHVVGLNRTTNMIVLEGAPAEAMSKGQCVAAHVTTSIDSWVVGAPMQCSKGVLTPVVIDPDIKTIFYAVAATTTMIQREQIQEEGKLKRFGIGGKIFEAASVEAALAMASLGKKSGSELCGFGDIVSYETLGPQAQEEYKMLQLFVMKGGEATMKTYANTIFKKYDADKDGAISRGELNALVLYLNRSLSLPGPDEALVEHLMQRYDRDNNGTISDDEFPFLYRRLLKRTLAKFKVADKKQLIRASRRDFNTKYELGRRLAAGAQGVTYLATERASGETVVVKKPNEAADTEDFEKVRDKAHPNIVRVFELFVSPGETYVVMECCSGGDLFGALKHCRDNFGEVSLEFCASAIEQTMLGVQYIHSQFKECHNDIKPENVLLDRKPASVSDVPRFMVADFGCASSDGSNINGDPRYNAPELWFQGGTVSYASDVWAIGVMMYEILSGGDLVFTDQKNISGWAAWSQFHRGELYHKLSSRIVQPGAQPNWTVLDRYGEGATLCQKMLAWHKQQRIELHKALQDPFFEAIRGSNITLDKDIVKKIGRRCDLSDLNMLLLNMVASKLQGENLEHYQRLWSTFDKEGRGTLPADQFQEMLVQQGMWKRVADDLSTLADIDASGDIDFNEFIAVMFNPDKLSPEALQAHLRHVFFDISGGTREISADDLVLAFPDSTCKELIDRLFQEMDKDSNSSVTQEEFERFLAHM